MTKECEFDVSIAGELNLDLILYGLPREMATERELLASDFNMTLGSSSGIVAHNLAALGMRVSFQGVIGDDALGVLGKKYLADGGVDVSGVKVLPGRTTGVTMLLPHGKERHILTYPGTIADLCVGDIDIEKAMTARHFHLSSLYLQRDLHAGLPGFLRELKTAGLTISLDTNDDPDDKWGAPLLDVLPFVDTLMPNESELRRMAKCDDFSGALEWVRGRVPTVVVKRGASGALILSNGQTYEAAPVRLDGVIDTIGAGDSFNAGFLAAMLSAKNLADAARCGNLAGALSTQGSGGIEAFTSATIRKQFLDQHDPDGILGSLGAPTYHDDASNPLCAGAN